MDVHSFIGICVSSIFSRYNRPNGSLCCLERRKRNSERKSVPSLTAVGQTHAAGKSVTVLPRGTFNESPPWSLGLHIAGCPTPIKHNVFFRGQVLLCRGYGRVMSGRMRTSIAPSKGSSLRPLELISPSFDKAYEYSYAHDLGTRAGHRDSRGI